MNFLTFVIPHYSDLAGLETLLASLDRELRASPSAATNGTRAIVVDDATPGAAGALEKLLRRHTWLDIVVNQENRGPAFSRNLGVERASSEWVWLLDSDVALEEGALGRMKDVLTDLDDACGVVSGVGLRTLSDESFQKYKNYLEYSWQPPSGATVVLDSKSVAVRRSVFQQIGGFDRAFGAPTVEDYDLGYRMAGAGHKLIYTREVKVLHHHPSFSRQWREFYKRTQGWVRLKSIYGLSFDDNGSSGREALLQIINLSILATLALVFVFPWLLLGTALGVAAWFAVNSKFTATVFENGERLGFLAHCLAYSCALCIPIWAGLVVGTIRIRAGRS